MSITRRQGHTHIGILSARTDAAAVTGVLGGVGAVLGSIGLGAVLVATAGLAVPLAGIVGMLGATGGSWGAMRVTWRRYARGREERAADLCAELATAARQAVEEGRVNTGRDNLT